MLGIEILKFAFEAALGLLAEQIVQSSKENTSSGFAISLSGKCTLSKRHLRISVARFGSLAKKSLNEWREPFHNQADGAVMFALEKGAILDDIFSGSPYELFIGRPPNLHIGAWLDGTKKFGIGVAGGKNEANTYTAQIIVLAMQGFLRKIIRECKKQDGGITDENARFAAKKILNRLKLEDWHLPNTWKDSPFWGRKIFHQ